MKIPELLRAWRFREEMTLKEMAARLEMPTPTYARIESGKGMSVDHLLKIIRWMVGD